MKNRPHVEILEARIAPANTFLPSDPNAYIPATLGGLNLIHAGQVLSTGGFDSGNYLLYVEKGDAFVFFTDLNNNTQIDFNEITGISASDGFRMTCFADIHGDIVTNLRVTTVSLPGGQADIRYTLSDSNNNSGDDAFSLGGDGRVLVNSTIEKIEMRSLTPTDVGDLNDDGELDQADVAIHQPIATASIFGTIYAGKGFGTADGKGGLIVDATSMPNFGFEVHPVLGGIKTGTAASGEYFTFGNSNLDNTSGYFLPFTPPRGQVGADINGVQVKNSPALNLDIIHAGDGGLGARGGHVSNVVLPYDDSGGYRIIAGNGGGGASGGAGGSVLNFTDLGSITGLVSIQSGDGGVGATGTGGNGGGFTFNTFNVRGDVVLELGSGGTGFTAGGNGASLTKGTFTQPNDTVGLSAGSSYGTTHIPSSLDPDGDPTNGGYAINQIGTHAVVDFNNDGFGDYVFTTLDTSQVIVALGDPDGTFFKFNRLDGTLLLDEAGLPIPNQISLSGVRNPEALVVADIDGDGHPDIAVGSIDEDNHEGIVTFLARYTYGTSTLPDDDVFQGFYDARFSPLPQLTEGDPDFYGPGNGFGPFAPSFVKAPHQISKLSAGDFNGDGQVEIAAVVTQYFLEESDENGVINNLDEFAQVVIFMTQDIERDNLTGLPVHTGHFYADLGTRPFSSDTGPVPSKPRIPFFLAGENVADEPNTPGSVIIEASPVSLGGGAISNHDWLFVGNQTKNQVDVYEYLNRSDVGPSFQPIRPGQLVAPSGGTGNRLGNFDLGTVDTIRQLGPNQNQQSDVLLQDFSVTDLNGDFRADLATISISRYLVGVVGTGNGSGAFGDSGIDNAGTFYGPGVGGTASGFGLVTSGTMLAVKTADPDFDPSTPNNTIYILDNLNNDGTRVTRTAYTVIPGANNLDSATFPVTEFSRPREGASAPTTEVSFDLHYVQVPSFDNPQPDVAVGAAFLDGQDAIRFAGSNSPLGNLRLPMSNTGFIAIAGDGGDSLIGRGGNGGLIGGAKLTQGKGTGAASVTGAVNFIYAGDLHFIGGEGGNGFAAGGSGGGISGVKVAYRPGVDIGLGVVATAGDGGRGVSGAGGNGGSVAFNSFETSLRAINATSDTIAETAYAVVVAAGDGGRGAVGGNGGSAIGNGTKAFDSFSTFIAVVAGNGGDGPRGGGNGGSVLNFRPTIPAPQNVSGNFGGQGSLQYVAGDGGDSVSGRGGNGGSIANSSPTDNGYIDGPVALIAGDAGNGLTGGNGGSVSKFSLFVSGLSALPSQVITYAGMGGSGSAGRGGNGGSIVEVTLPSRGVSGNFNGVLAGDGGDSAGSIGGNGGGVATVRVTSTQGAIAITGGAGGSGLLRGGDGGNVAGLVPDTGESTTSKVLIVAGAGGDATAFIPNTGTTGGILNDPSPFQSLKAFGGQVGVGGAGGSISSINQPAGNQGSHFDLIAGNGGSTLNYGTIFDTKTFVGKGGSVLNVNVVGDFGNSQADNPATPFNENIPIKDYNDISVGQTVADYVRDQLRSGIGQLNDAAGNVGIVVGESGRNKSVIFDPVNKPDTLVSRPPAVAVNGSLTNITGHSLMAAVAGSVEVIAAIQVAKNINIEVDPIGADKGGPLPDDGTVGIKNEFLDSDGAPTNTPEPGGKLIDGTLFAKNL